MVEHTATKQYMGSAVSKQQSPVKATMCSDTARLTSNETLEMGSDECHDDSNPVVTNITGSDGYVDNVCVSCHRVGTTAEVFGYCNHCNERLCEICYNKHTQITPSNVHSLLPDNNVLSSIREIAIADTQPTSHLQKKLTNQNQVSTETKPSQTKLDNAISTSSQTNSNQRQYKAKTSVSVTKRHTNTASTSSQHFPVSTAIYDNIKPKYQGVLHFYELKPLSRITGMTLLHPGGLVLADRHYKHIRLRDSSTTFALSDAPWDITSTSRTQVAVTVPDIQQIQFITVEDTEDIYHLSYTIKTSGNCHGICCYQDKLVVTYLYPGKVEVMTKKGKVITCVKKDSTGAEMFIEPSYVQANSSSIYVTDCWKKQVIMLNWQGEITGRIRVLGRPDGLTLLPDGSLLVCARCSDLVYHVSGDCTNKRVVIENALDPLAICVNDKERRLYISGYSYYFSNHRRSRYVNEIHEYAF